MERSLIFCNRATGSEQEGTTGWMGLGWNRNAIGPADPGAHHAYIAFSPAKNVGVFVLSNTDHPDGAGPGAIARHVLRSC